MSVESAKNKIISRYSNNNHGENNPGDPPGNPGEDPDESSPGEDLNGEVNVNAPSGKVGEEIYVPINEAADYFAGWEGATGKDLRNQLFKEHYKAEAYNKWFREFFDRYMEAKSQGANKVRMPDMPPEVSRELVPSTEETEKENPWKGMGEALAPIMIMKSMLGEEGEKKGDSIKDLTSAMMDLHSMQNSGATVVTTDENGNKEEKPVNVYMMEKGLSNNPNENSETTVKVTNENGETEEIPVSQYYARKHINFLESQLMNGDNVPSEPTVTITKPDGSVVEMPESTYREEILLNKIGNTETANPGKGEEGEENKDQSDLISTMMTTQSELYDQLHNLQAQIQKLSDPANAADRVVLFMDKYEDIRNKFRENEPGSKPGDSGSREHKPTKEERDRERRNQVKLEQEKTNQKKWEVLGKFIHPSEPKKEEDEEEEVDVEEEAEKSINESRRRGEAIEQGLQPV